MSVKMKREPMTIKSYMPKEPVDLPMFFEKRAHQGASGKVYPIPFVDQLTDEPTMKQWDSIELSNEYITVTLLPEIGGKIHGAKDNRSGYEFIYQNTVIKPALVGIAGPWVSGGVEFNWPQHHRPTTFMPVEATLQNNPDGSKTCWMGESEPFHRMRASVGVTVYPGSSIVEAKAIVHNRSDKPLPFMWWNNLAVRVHSQYKATFPQDVEYGCDHDRRAVIPFPIMKGVYHTARPYDYGEGTDATWFNNVMMPTSVMIPRGQSHMDFVAGYDFKAKGGTVTVADHHVSTGKKMWTWGDSDFGRAWSANLTDNEDRYIELMTGVYTDNQPDFTMLGPGETKEFTQVWYPINEIGEVINASRDAALSLKIKEDEVEVGVVVTSEQENLRILAWDGEKLVGEERADLSPDGCLIKTFKRQNPGTDSITVEVTDNRGRCLVSHKPYEKGKKEKPATRKPAPFPKEVDSVELLYLHGSHLEQYKHFTHRPEDYYLEALQRDPQDYRCNLAMGRLQLEKGDFEGARICLERAKERITLRNDNPSDSEVYYQLGRLELLEQKLEKANDFFRAAAWQYQWRSAAYYESACIENRLGNRLKAIELLKVALETNTKHFSARVLLGYLQKNASDVEKVLEDSPQDSYARGALYFITGRPLEPFVLNRPEDVLDIALDFKKAGLTQEAAVIIKQCTKPSQLLHYHLAALEGEDAVHTDLYLCFPNRLEDITVLSVDQWQAQYLLGCLYYDKGNYEKALACWEWSKDLNPNHAFTFRNLALGYFDHFDQKEKGLDHLRQALILAPENPRILYETLQAMKNLGYSVKERLALLEAHPQQVKQRDDCYLDWIVLYTQDQQLEKAAQLILEKGFHIYEGGEGNLTRHHAWLHLLRALKAQAEGEDEKALQYLAQGLVFPDNYGEGRHYSAQEGNIHYFTGLLLRKLGREEEAKEAFLKAVNQPAHVTEISIFTALALRALGRRDQAEAFLQSMAFEARQMLTNAQRMPYYGVGTPAPLPFELELDKTNSKNGLLILGLAEKYLGHEKEADNALRSLKEMDPYNTKASFLEMAGIL